MRDEGLHGAGERRAKVPGLRLPGQSGPSGGTNSQFAPGPQAVLAAAKGSAAAASAADPVAGAGPEGQSGGAAPPGALRPPRTLSAVARTLFLLGVGAAGALLVVGVGALIALSLVTSRDVDPNGQVHASLGEYDR